MKNQFSIPLIFLLFVMGCSIDSGETKKKANNPYASWYQVASGKPAALVFASYKTTMIADGNDEALLRISAVDSAGMEIMDATLPFTISVKGDAIEILKNHGFNYIRLRIFVNPENELGYSPNSGFCGLDSTLMMARRVKKAGLNLLLDFHYSDTWADPQKQFKPKAWQELSFNDLSTRLNTYTKLVLLKLKEQETMPEMVQIGNEINHGIVWPEGHISNLDQLAELLKAGTRAVREIDTSCKVMMHLALGGQNEETVFWFDNMIARGVEFDIIGLSYYPRWHCTLDDLNNNMLDILQRYQKDINVVEYSAFKREVNNLVFELPENRGNGTCIWEPLNTWSRIFDSDGNALKEINIYDEIKAEYLPDWQLPEIGVLYLVDF